MVDKDVLQLSASTSSQLQGLTASADSEMMPLPVFWPVTMADMPAAESVTQRSEADVSISAPLLKVYRRNLDAFRSEIKDFASRRGMHYVFTSTAVPFHHLILDYLRKRGLLK